MKNFILGILTVVIIGGLVGGAYYFGKQSTKSGQTPTPAPTAASLSSAPEITTAPSPTVAALSDEEMIRAALYKKNSWPEGSVNVVVTKNDGTYAKGTANSQGGGGLFFAVKRAGEWKIVADGNGIIPCDSLKDYPDYPNSLIPECYDTVKGELVKR